MNRLATWLLADYCQWIGTDPSERLRLAQAGFSADACLDFDLAVRGLKRWADARENETVLVDDDRPANSKPKKAVPKYRTLAEVLALDPAQTEAAEIAGLVPERDLDRMARELLDGRDG